MRRGSEGGWRCAKHSSVGIFNSGPAHRVLSTGAVDWTVEWFVCGAILGVKRVGPNYTHANFPLPTPVHRPPTKHKVYLFAVNFHCTYNALLGSVL
jgi:hypothetical protein